jgi:UPF0176 protein
VTYTIAAFYRFISVSKPTALAEKLRTVFCEGDLCGTMLIADEGVNGTMAGSPETIDHFLDMLAEEVGLEMAEVKLSFSQKRPFKRQKFQIKPEIITFRKAKVDPTKPGQYVAAEEWNALIAETDVLLLDTRNRYETDLGTFDGATVPGIETFSDFVTYVRENLDAAKHKKVAMFCTGGIRCEKASAFMLQEGFEEVYHLKGGVLKYLEQVPEQVSKWRGECYVFDRRTSVRHEDLKVDTSIGTQ